MRASTYVRELAAITMAVKKWRQYLLGHHFTIVTDHHSLKELLNQVIQTPEQHMYLARLMGYDYDIQYRSGSHNQAADALSQLPESDSSTLMVISVHCYTFMKELRQQLQTHPQYQQQLTDVLRYAATHPGFSVSQGLLLHKGRIWLPQGLPIISTLLMEFHATPTGGHAGVAKTIARITETFTWPGLRHDVTQFVANCVECQVTKYETKKAAGLLCPLPIPHRPWEDLSLDFIVGLPPYKNYTVILVVVNHFSKGIHLGMLPSSHSAPLVASLFLDIVVKLHGLPRSLVSDHDPLFVSQFWQELFRASGTKLRMSLAYHPQSDGQTEVLNRIIEQYLRAFVHRHSRAWEKLLPWVELSHNTSWNEGTRMTPYEVKYGQKPLNLADQVAGDSKVDVVQEILTGRDDTFRTIRKKLFKAQTRMEQQADKKHREVNYQPGEWVYVKLRPRRQGSAKGVQVITDKLAKRYYGPFRVLERLGPVAYKFHLLEEARIHPMFHCSLFKPFHGSPETTPTEDWYQIGNDYHLEDKVDLQGPRDDTNTETTSEVHLAEDDTNIEPTSTESKTEVHLAEKPKRKLTKPAYLRDYV